jgi:hypothetical protein
MFTEENHSLRMRAIRSRGNRSTEQRLAQFLHDPCPTLRSGGQGASRLQGHRLETGCPAGWQTRLRFPKEEVGCVHGWLFLARPQMPEGHAKDER